MTPITVKKYPNRRLYDTEESRYVTQEELAEKIRGGVDVRVVDARTNEDLTQATLLQLIMESSAAKLLPVSVLSRLIRMKDDALAEFFGRHVATTLDLYLAFKQGAQSAMPFFPWGAMPFGQESPFARFIPRSMWDATPPPAPSPRSEAAPDVEAAPAAAEEVSALRQELDALKKEVRGFASKRRGK